nr:H(+)/Cl(-) exchange transporter 7-like [Procambarus clarkii]
MYLKAILKLVEHMDACVDNHHDLLENVKSSEDDYRNATVRNRTFFPDQQEKPCIDHRGQLNVLSAAYESMDYETCVNSTWLDEERTNGYSYVMKKNIARWLVVLMIAALTALVACAMEISIETLSNLKFSWLKEYLDYDKNSSLVIPFLLCVTLSVGPTLVAAFLGSYVEPLSAGSGIPQVKCYLNGVNVPRIVRLKTLLCKVLGLIMSVLGGLAIGKEGPIIHFGAIIAAGVSQGKTSSFNYDFGIFEYFREDHEKRDFVSAGAAAGVSAAFGAPVGGVLFSLEEAASYWNQALTWRVFFGAMMSSFTVNLILSTYNGVPGTLTFNGLLDFGKFVSLTYEIWEFVPFLLMGVAGGLLGAVFNLMNQKLTSFRMKYIYKPWQKILEATVIAFVTAVVSFLTLYLIQDCHIIKENTAVHPIQMFCSDGEENAANIWYQSPEKSVRSLFHDPPDAFEWPTITVFFVTYYFLACWSYGMGVPSGLFIPMLLCGAAGGRLVGKLMTFLFPNQPWVHEGKYALVGAAALLGGVVRMTISLTACLLECVGNITFGLPIMTVLMVAKWVGDFFNEGLYEIHIQMLGLPMMAWDAPALSNNVYASEVMSRPVATIRSVESVKRIVNLLKQYNYNGFPIVDGSPTAYDSQYILPCGTLRGLILRSQLLVLLKYKIFNENNEVWQNSKVNIRLFRLSYPRYFTLEEVDLNPEDMNCTVDIRPFYNPSPYSVIACTSLPRMFNLFRALGLRHLVVVDDNNIVVGMVTRKDLVKYRIWKHRGQMGLEELVIYNNLS